MSENKGKEAAAPPPPPTWISQMLAAYRSLPGAALLFAVIPLLVLGYVGWFYWGAEHLNRALYAVKLENLIVTKQPPWILKSNVREEVFHNGNLSGVHLLDSDASAAISRAFESHAWVQSVFRVSKLGGRKVQVDLIYREPIAMVYFLPSGTSDHDSEVQKPGAYPVDREGIVLPTEDFTLEHVGNYFLIYAQGAAPKSEESRMPFGDSRISDALQLCQLLIAKREALGLKIIYVNADKEVGGATPWSLAIATRDLRIIEWGHTPGKESSDEPSAEDKLMRMERWLTATHSSTAKATRLNLRSRSFSNSKLTGSVPSD